jgi:hypothetical protein
VEAELEAGLAFGVDEAVGFFQGEEGGVQVSQLDECACLRNRAPAGEVRIRVLAVEEQLGRGVEELDCFREAPLCRAERCFEVQEDGVVAEGVGRTWRRRCIGGGSRRWCGRSTSRPRRRGRSR